MSFSGGKDSTVCLNLALQVARERGRLPLDVVFFDEEAIAPPTVDYAARVAANPDIAFSWFCLPLRMGNACSRSRPVWYGWAPEDRAKWVRDLPAGAITEHPRFKRGMSLHEFSDLLYGVEKGTSAMILGIRAQESIVRWRSICTKRGFEAFISTRAGVPYAVKASPIYDWKSEDVWRAPHQFGWDYNHAYDQKNKFGHTLLEARIAPPFGDQSFRALDHYQACWPEFWEKLAERVPGAKTAARYSKTALYGRAKASEKADPRRAGESWRSYTLRRIRELPAANRSEVADGVYSLLRKHRNRTTAPMPDDGNDPTTGLSWKLLATIATLGSNKFERPQQAALSKATKFLLDQEKESKK